MRNLKIVMSYDGTPFSGWQVQPGRMTVQGELAAVLERITGENLLPQGSGRTDAGVHARGQVASFQTESAIPCENFVKALNGMLPAAARVLSVEEVPMDFHARHSATCKIYEYRIFRGSICPPFLVNFVCHHPYPLDEAALFLAAREVIGEHDFTSFAAVDPAREQRAEAGGDPPNNIRSIHSSEWRREGEEIIYTVRGNGFLHHMVRNLVGTFLLVGKGSLSVADIGKILKARNRTAAGPTAPPQGLYLVNVEYASIGSG